MTSNSISNMNTNDLASLALHKKENLLKIKHNFEEILKGLDDVMCTDHTKLKTIYISDHPDTPGKGGFICDYCPNPSSKMKFYSQILSDYADVIKQIKTAGEQKSELSVFNTQKTIEVCGELTSQVEFSFDTLKNLTANFDQFFVPGVFAKIATSEELFKLNEILKTISFNEKGKPIYESIGKHPERETQYVKLAKILISFKDENFDMNQKFSAVLQEFITRIITSRNEIVHKTSELLKFLTSEFYEFIFKMDGASLDDEFRSSLRYRLYTHEEWEVISLKLREAQENLNSERSLRIKLEEDFRQQNDDLLTKLMEYEGRSELAYAQAEDQEDEYQTKIDSLNLRFESEFKIFSEKAEAEKAELYSKIEILNISLKQAEEKFTFMFQDNAKILLKLEESENKYRNIQIAFDELKLNFDLQAQKLQALDGLEDLRARYQEAIISRQNLSESFNDEKLFWQNRINQLELENAEIKKKIEINIKSESTVISLNSKISELTSKLNLSESRLNTEISSTKSLTQEKAQLLEKINSLTNEVSSLTIKYTQLSQEANQYLDLSSLNCSLLSDLKKQVNINRNLELTIQELQQKINNYNNRVQANEQLIKNQLEIIRRYTDDKVLIYVDERSEMLMNSKKETDLIIEKIEKLERDPLYKSVIINMPGYDSNNSNMNLLDASFVKSVTNSTFRPSSPVLCASGQRSNANFTQHNYANSGGNLSSLLVSNGNAVNFRAMHPNLLGGNSLGNNNNASTNNNTDYNSNNSNNNNYNNSNNITNNNDKSSNDLSGLLVRKGSSRIMDRSGARSASVKLQKKPYKINFSKDLLLNNESWETIRNWIETTDIFINPIQPKLLFKGTRDGFRYNEFQKRCSGIKNTLVIAKTSFGKVIGGFTPLAWGIPNESYLYVEDSNSETFLFSINLGERYDLKPKEFAICLSQKNGPIFGGGSDLEIVDECDKEFNQSSNVGHSFYYSKTPEAFYGGRQYLVSEYEVYQIL